MATPGAERGGMNVSRSFTPEQAVLGTSAWGAEGRNELTNCSQIWTNLGIRLPETPAAPRSIPSFDAGDIGDN